MPFPTVGQTAFFTTTTSGGLGIYSVIRFSQLVNVKPRSVPQLVAYGALSFLGTAGSAGSAKAWFESNARTTPEEYLKNAANGTGVIAGAMVTYASQAVFMAVIEGVQGAVRESVYEAIKGKAEKGPDDPKNPRP